MTETPSFGTVRRGYDPDQVNQHLARLRQNHQGLVDEAAATTVEISRLRSELEETRQHNQELAEKVDHLERSLGSGKLNLADLGPRISQMLTLAEDEASDMRASARVDADTVAREAASASQRLREEADEYAMDVRSRADNEAAVVIETARRDSDDLLDQAEREASTRRREAEAVYEEQRAAAAAAAADFESTLAERREAASDEFASQMANQQRSLSIAQENLADAEAEAARVLAEANAEADAEREKAQREARQALETARGQAERVRRESERELAALAARRDAITEQLTNVRQMLATLGGAQAVGLLKEATPEPETTPEAEATPGDAGDVE